MTPFFKKNPQSFKQRNMTKLNLVIVSNGPVNNIIIKSYYKVTNSISFQHLLCQTLPHRIFNFKHILSFLCNLQTIIQKQNLLNVHVLSNNDFKFLVK